MSGSTSVPMTHCPACGYAINAAAPHCLHGRIVRPKPGDFSVCMRCGAALRYDELLCSRLATDAEVMQLDPNLRGLLEATQRQVIVMQAREAQSAARRS